MKPDPHRQIALRAARDLELTAMYLRQGRAQDALRAAIRGGLTARRELKQSRTTLPPAVERRLVSEGSVTQT